MRPARVGALGGRGRVGARLARFVRAVVPAVALGSEVRTVAPTVLALWTLVEGTGLCRLDLVAAGLTGSVAEGLALPILLDASRRFGRKDLQLGLWLDNGGFDRRWFSRDRAGFCDRDRRGRGCLGGRGRRSNRSDGGNRDGRRCRGFCCDRLCRGRSRRRRSERILVFCRSGEDGHRGGLVVCHRIARGGFGGRGARTFASGEARPAIVAERTWGHDGWRRCAGRTRSLGARRRGAGRI